MILYLLICVLLTGYSIRCFVQLIQQKSARKIKRSERNLCPPFMLFFPTFLCMIIGSVVGEIQIHKENYSDAVIFFLLQVVGFYFSVYATRWQIIYRAQDFVYRSAFGKMKQYSYGDVKCMKQILGDLFLCVGHRCCLIDFTQQWMDFEKTFRIWQRNQGKTVPKKVYRTKVGKNLSNVPGGFGFFLFYCILFFGTGTLFGIIGICGIIVFRQIVSFILLEIMAVAAFLAGILMVLPLIDRKKYKKLFQKFWKNSIFDCE